MTQLPKLYKRTKTDAIQLCSITVQDDTYTVEWGQVDGTMQTKDTICKPKNVGRSNETTAEQQAQAEAQSKWQKKVDSGYTEDPSGEIEVKLPMKVKTYQGQEKNIIFPCYGSPKLNGVNSTFRLETDEEGNDTLTHWSRGGKEYPLLPHLTEDIIYGLKDLKTNEVNGETYKHGMFLEDITSAVKKANENTPKLEFYAFEFPNIPLEFDEKQYVLHGSAFSTPEVVELHSHEEIQDYHDRCVKDGYEGIVIRNGSCIYEHNVRSSNAFKLKKALDAEFQILDCETDKNEEAVFHCATAEGKVFKVKPKGTRSVRQQMVRDFETKYLNKWLTVEFESWSKYGIPLKPIGVGLRECNSDGNPLE